LFGHENLPDSRVNETALLKDAHKQISEYLKGERRSFDLPLSPSGTEFQQRVWKALTGIPYGETVTYEDIARKVGNEKACRAVGMANNRNPISLIIPCHRVIGKNGKLTGYGGGLGIKEYLLKLERGNI
jgi:methylated-DNA-[protein]-cysteine S-methyltransferase